MVLGPEYLQDMQKALRMFCTDVGQFIHSYGSVPAVGSQAETEKNTFARPESVVTAWGIGATLIEFGGDHVSLFVKTLDSPVEIIACWTCIRSMLESCSVAAWLLDPSIDAKTRVGRVFAHRYEGLEQQLKLGKALGRSAKEIADEEVRIDGIEAIVLKLGYARILNRKGERIGLCQPTPNATEMIENVLGEGVMYRMLSGVAHGHHWAINGLCFKPTTDDLDLGGVTVTKFERTDDIQGIALLGLCAMKSIARPIWNQCHYFGWDTLKLEEIFENVADMLQASEDRRFWRS